MKNGQTKGNTVRTNNKQAVSWGGSKSIFSGVKRLFWSCKHRFVKIMKQHTFIIFGSVLIVTMQLPARRLCEHIFCLWSDAYNTTQEIHILCQKNLREYPCPQSAWHRTPLPDKNIFYSMYSTKRTIHCGDAICPLNGTAESVTE